MGFPLVRIAEDPFWPLHRRSSPWSSGIFSDGVLEAEEYSPRGQKGSSAMPQQANPISAENSRGWPAGPFPTAWRLSRYSPVARTGHQPFLGGAGDRSGCHDSGRLHAHPLFKHRGTPHRLPGDDEGHLEKMGGLIYSEAVLLLLTRKGLSGKRLTPWSSGMP